MNAGRPGGLGVSPQPTSNARSWRNHERREAGGFGGCPPTYFEPAKLEEL